MPVYEDALAINVESRESEFDQCPQTKHIWNI